MAFVIHLTVFQSTGKNNDLKGRLHDREKMVRIRQKLERFQQFLQRNSPFNPGNDFQLLLPDGTPAGVVNCTIYDDLRQL